MCCLHLTLISAPRRLADGEPQGALGVELKFLRRDCKLSFFCPTYSCQIDLHKNGKFFTTDCESDSSMWARVSFHSGMMMGRAPKPTLVLWKWCVPFWQPSIWLTHITALKTLIYFSVGYLDILNRLTFTCRGKMADLDSCQFIFICVAYITDRALSFSMS